MRAAFACWTLAVGVLVLMGAAARVQALTFTDTDHLGIFYSATVTSLGGNLYSVSVTINTSGYTGTQNAWLDWFKLKVSPQNPTNVTNVIMPSGWSVQWGYSGAGGSVDLLSASYGPPGATPDLTDIAIPVSGPRPTISLSYQVDLTGTSLKLDEWPYQARYLFAESGQEYTQTIVSRELTPQGDVIPEPTTLVLFGMGLAAPLVVRWRKR